MDDTNPLYSSLVGIFFLSGSPYISLEEKNKMVHFDEGQIVLYIED